MIRKYQNSEIDALKKIINTIDSLKEISIDNKKINKNDIINLGNNEYFAITKADGLKVCFRKQYKINMRYNIPELFFSNVEFIIYEDRGKGLSHKVEYDCSISIVEEWINDINEEKRLYL